MDKQKQIEEMAKIICKDGANNGDCDKCGFHRQCSKFKVAEKLYNAGYRKADDLLKELQSMKSDFAKDMLEIKETYEKEVVDLVNEVRKETAEKFAERLKARLDISVNGYSTSEVMSEIEDKIDEIAKEITEGKV